MEILGSVLHHKQGLRRHYIEILRRESTSKTAES